MLRPPRVMSLCAECPAEASSPTDGTPVSSSASGSVSRCQIPHCARDNAHAPTQDKPILAPPMFIFQKMTGPVKRTLEHDGSAAVVNKRIRSITYPSLLSRTKKGSLEGGRRMRSSSFSSPLPLNASPLGKVKSMQLKPASFVEPKQHCHDLPHFKKVGLDADGDFSKSKISHSSSADALQQRILPQNSRSLFQMNTGITGVQFVFGENMSERVVRPCSDDMSDSDGSSTDSDSPSTEATTKMTVRHTLWESAAAYTASSRHRCLLKQVQVITGEENESNVVQLMCKLFILERGTQSWTERGRGVLRLNDLQTKYKGCLQSRMVMRHQGSLKLILNTKLYPHTHLQRPTRRNLQVTATDLESHSVRVFLIQASARDIARLYVAIHHRLVALRHINAAFSEQEGHYSSDEDDEYEKEKALEKRVLSANTRSGDCNRRNTYPRLCT
ncbi:ran-binding protein 3-like isoform X3 [Trichomycterus rosablanca]|uniref:ran-binding protein 3-like isoform X3 n=1 Tax=Trichomycterus rosablanca TaxID=2290929 RepID=UPI002F35A6A6